MYMKHTDRTLYSNAGLTLAECMVAVAIIAILAALATPDLIYSRDLRRLKAAANEYHMTLQRARAVAIKSRGNCTVNINANQCTLTCPNDASANSTTIWNSYSTKLLVTAAAPNTITFNSRGTCNSLYTYFSLNGPKHVGQYRAGTFITGKIVKEFSPDETWP
jgi:prepilin-type N-terminal cleavage/methylation domain-containing protein